MLNQKAGESGEPELRLQAAESRGKILEVAETLFSGGGYSAVGMRQLATAAGLSKSALFHHFPTKSDLYAAVLDQVLERLEDALGEETESDPCVRLDRWIGSVAETLADDEPAARLLMRVLMDETPLSVFRGQGADRILKPFERRLARIVERLRGPLEEGIALGTFRPVATDDSIQRVMGVLFLHFGSGHFREEQAEERLSSKSAASRRSEELAGFIRRGLLA
ncbi:MAG: TetR/AcrR family transcriptional regulator [Myxococcota bacterium]